MLRPLLLLSHDYIYTTEIISLILSNRICKIRLGRSLLLDPDVLHVQHINVEVNSKPHVNNSSTAIFLWLCRFFLTNSDVILQPNLILSLKLLVFLSKCLMFLKGGSFLVSAETHWISGLIRSALSASSSSGLIRLTFSCYWEHPNTCSVRLCVCETVLVF